MEILTSFNPSVNRIIRMASIHFSYTPIRPTEKTAKLVCGSLICCVCVVYDNSKKWFPYIMGYLILLPI